MTNYIAWLILIGYGFWGFMGTLFVGLLLMASGFIDAGKWSLVVASLAVTLGLGLFGKLVQFVLMRKKNLPKDFDFALSWLWLPFFFSSLLMALGMLLTNGSLISYYWRVYALINLPFSPLALFMLTNGGLFYYSLLVSLLQGTIAGAGSLVLIKRYKLSFRALPKKWWLAMASLLLITSCSLSVSYKFMKQNNELAGYGFEYANGLSSVDLWDYDATNMHNKLPLLTEDSQFQLSNLTEMPILDGAEAAYPVYSAFGRTVYNQEVIRKALKLGLPEEVNPIRFSNTLYAFDYLVAGNIDIFFGAHPSKKQLAAAEKAGVELEITPIAKEAFIFIVSNQNPVSNLTSKEIREIYTGKINNWQKVGGANQKILAFQRPEGSGSQTMMTYFMGDSSLIEPLKVELVGPMSGLYDQVADYQGQSAGIGYSFRFFSEMSGKKEFKILNLDGVPVTKETITKESYPLVIPLVAVTLKEPQKVTVKPFVQWMLGSQGQTLVEESGYIRVN